MKIKADPEKKYDVGVIVGRFQVHDLDFHGVYTDLIQHVVDNHKKVIIFLGLSPLLVTKRNPLDFEARRQMIKQAFPDVVVHWVKDVHSDELWSKNLDEQIRGSVSHAQSVALYGARDSFLSHYTGSFDVIELESDKQVSATDVRKLVSKDVKASADFRAGVIWAAYNKFPTAYQCVDVAPFTTDYKHLYLIRKHTETKYRLVGGFAEPRSTSLLNDAQRELTEETGLRAEPQAFRMLDVYRMDDWRYRSEEDVINTILFGCTIMMGSPKIEDTGEIAEVLKAAVSDLKNIPIVENHKPLVRRSLMWAAERESK